MKIHNLFSSTRQRWLKKPLSSQLYQPWLLEKGSLTARLQQHYVDFYVRLVSVRNRKMSSEDAAFLRMKRHGGAQVREVLLYGNHQPVVFAHSVLPRKSLRGAWRGLGRIGNTPLGAVLFSSPKVKRIPLTYKKLTTNHALYQAAIPFVNDPPAYLWARRSVFSLNCASIMVVEVFLPQLVVAATD